MTSWKSLLLLSFIDLFLKGGIDVEATEANFFQIFFFFNFNVISESLV